MKKIYLGAAVAGLALLVTAAGTPSQAITAQGDVQANIISSLSFTKVDTLDFGSIMSDTAGSVVRIEPNTGARTLVSGTGTLVTGGTEGDGTFSLDGVSAMDVFIDIPASATVVNGSHNMTVSNFVWSYNGDTPSSVDGVVTLGLLGPLFLSIGADLTVAANQAAGLYTGTYSVTVNYQ